jgi:hypothetical protein
MNLRLSSIVFFFERRRKCQIERVHICTSDPLIFFNKNLGTGVKLTTALVPAASAPSPSPLSPSPDLPCPGSRVAPPRAPRPPAGCPRSNPYGFDGQGENGGRRAGDYAERCTHHAAPEANEFAASDLLL